jgi:hypothetical protein
MKERQKKNMRLDLETESGRLEKEQDKEAE